MWIRQCGVYIIKKIIKVEILSLEPYILIKIENLSVKLS